MWFSMPLDQRSDLPNLSTKNNLCCLYCSGVRNRLSNVCRTFAWHPTSSLLYVQLQCSRHLFYDGGSEFNALDRSSAYRITVML